MQRYDRWQFLPRVFLWSHVIGVVGFYLVNRWRTAPGKNDVLLQYPQAGSEQHEIPASTPPLSGIPMKQKEVVVASAPERESTVLSEGKPQVSIIVPARNEERNIRRCVSSLLEQDYENFEVVVVDDGSTDNTGKILDELAVTHPNGRRLWVLRLRDLPPGWAGKPHAIHQGVQEASGTWLLFTDADTRHAPNALCSALTQAMAEQADLFTLGSTQELPDFWNRVLMPVAFMGISLLYPPRLVNDPRSPVAVANGQFILLRRAVYEMVGGYARRDLRYTLLDDRDLARVVKDNGFKLRFVDGRGLVHVQMYHGFAEICSGWRKNAYLGNRGGLPFFLLQLIGLPMISVVPFLLPLFAWFTRKQRTGRISPGEANVATSLEVLSLLAYRRWLNQQLDVPWYYALTQPLAALIFDGILGQSVWRILTRQGVDWRGRAYHNENGVKQTDSLTLKTNH
jgi:chlorobactene glucosyltransferase